MSNTNIENRDLEEFLKLWEDSDQTQVLGYNGSKLQLNLGTEFSKRKPIWEKAFNEVDILVGDTLEAKLSTCSFKNTKIFFGIDDFFKKYDGVKTGFDSMALVILQDQGHYLVKYPNQGYDSYSKVFHNIHQYYQILDFFLNTPEFTPYKSQVDSQFTLISKEHGVFNIGYKQPEPIFFEQLDLRNLLSRFQEEFKKKEFIQFFKEIVIAGVHNATEEYRYNQILKQHNTLLNLAQRDFETYVSNFAFDKIKSEFKEEREKYFSTIDKNIESIGKQVISFPLTFGATVFASYKVKDKPEFLFLILGAYFLYTVIAFLVLNMTAYNVKCLRKDVNGEEETIKKSYGKIYDDFKDDFQKIRRKVANLRVIIGALYFVLTVLLVLFVVFTLYYVNLPAAPPTDS